MQKGGLKLDLFSNFSALGMPWSWLLDQLTKTNTNYLACLGLDVIFHGFALPLNGCGSRGRRRENCLYPRQPFTLSSFVIVNWKGRLTLELNSHMIKCVSFIVLLCAYLLGFFVEESRIPRFGILYFGQIQFSWCQKRSSFHLISAYKRDLIRK